MEIARAISSHRFEEAFPYLADDVSWTIVGAEPIAGKAAVIATCEESAAYLSGVTTEFRRFRTVVGENAVVIDSLADYVGPDGEKSTVASCDIYDFVDGRLTSIVSYNIEVAGDA